MAQRSRGTDPQRRPVTFERTSFWDEIRRNEVRTYLVIGIMLVIVFGLIFFVGLLMGLPPLFTFPLALGLGLLYVWLMSKNSVATVIKATGARPANPEVRDEKLLIHRVEEMALAAGVPVPGTYVQESKDPNAFAAGLKPEEAIICVTTGGLELWNNEQLEGVIAHEMGHVVNRDVRLSTITVAVVGAVAMVSEIMLRAFFWSGGGGGKRDVPWPLIVLGILFILLAPVFSRLTYLAISRKREYLADATAVRLTRNAEGLAGALEVLRDDLPDDPKGSRTAAALYIGNPWKRTNKTSLFSTHPPLDERVRRIRAMG